MADQQSRAKEASLVGALKNRVPEAWAALYDEHSPALFRYVLVRTSDTSAAEDLAATVFLEALKGIDSYHYRGKPVLAWLYRIARNLVSDHFSSVRRKQGQPLSTVREHVLSGSGASPHAVGSSALPGDPAGDVHLLDMRNALLRLKDAHREVLALHYYLGLSLPEVARVLGKKERAVYSLHARAIEALRKRVV